MLGIALVLLPHSAVGSAMLKTPRATEICAPWPIVRGTSHRQVPQWVVVQEPIIDNTFAWDFISGTSTTSTGYCAGIVTMEELAGLSSRERHVSGADGPESWFITRLNWGLRKD